MLRSPAARISARSLRSATRTTARLPAWRFAAAAHYAARVPPSLSFVEAGAAAYASPSSQTLSQRRWCASAAPPPPTKARSEAGQRAAGAGQVSAPAAAAAAASSSHDPYQHAPPAHAGHTVSAADRAEGAKGPTTTPKEPSTAGAHAHDQQQQDSGSAGSSSSSITDEAQALTAAAGHWAQGQIDSTRRTWRNFESWQRGVLSGIGVVTGIAGVVYWLWDLFSSDATQQTKHVASDVLRDRDVRDRAFAATKDLVQAVLRDDDAVDLLVDVVQRLLQQEGSRQSVGIFIKSIFEDEYIQMVTKKFVRDIVYDDWIREQLLEVARVLTLDLLQDKQTKEAMTAFLVETSSSALQDESLHRKGGSAIKGAVGSALVPSWFGGGGSKASNSTTAAESTASTSNSTATANKAAATTSFASPSTTTSASALAPAAVVVANSGTAATTGDDDDDLSGRPVKLDAASPSLLHGVVLAPPDQTSSG